MNRRPWAYVSCCDARGRFYAIVAASKLEAMVIMDNVKARGLKRGRTLSGAPRDSIRIDRSIDPSFYAE